MAGIIEKSEWARNASSWQGAIELGRYGAGLSLIFNLQENEGGGPRLHMHPYPETFVLRTGRARFTVADETFVAGAGQILVVPANTPHKFSAIGGEPFESINIHPRDQFETTWLE